MGKVTPLYSDICPLGRTEHTPTFWMRKLSLKGKCSWDEAGGVGGGQLAQLHVRSWWQMGGGLLLLLRLCLQQHGQFRGQVWQRGKTMTETQSDLDERSLGQKQGSHLAAVRASPCHLRQPARFSLQSLGMPPVLWESGSSGSVASTAQRRVLLPPRHAQRPQQTGLVGPSPELSGGRRLSTAG